MLQRFAKYNLAAINIPGRPVQVKSICGKHWSIKARFVRCVFVWVYEWMYVLVCVYLWGHTMPLGNGSGNSVWACVCECVYVCVCSAV